MQQLIQKLKDGKVEVSDLPFPLCNAGMVQVKNRYSLVSPGTEGSTVKAARKSLLGKAKERPQQLKQVLDVLKTQGITSTVRTVTKKLESLSPLGYSCVGQVIDVGSGVSGVSVGDYVACGGNSANHAEVVSVPENLCVKLEIEDASRIETMLRSAAYNTLGAIAMQGVRQADLRLGESCAVIGLGLLGQLTCLLLKASGVRVVGIDIAESAVSLAAQHSADRAFLQTDSSALAQISDFSSGQGVDAVIITAAANDTGPINFAGEILRKRGRVVVVGDVATGFERNPHYYRKELELRMSCSYGPGRYDPAYEEKGHDYPLAYVRWTEKRNMASFQALLRSGAIDIEYLTTHEFALEDAPQAYDMIVNRTEPCLGVLIEYDAERSVVREKISVRPAVSGGEVKIALVGAGNYAQGNLLPNLPTNDSSIARKIVMTNSGATSRGVAERFGFETCTADKNDIFDDADINTVFVSTRHDSHAEYVIDSIAAGKNVFVEKPLCIRADELEKIKSAISSSSEMPALMVGYNRRFSPFAEELKARFGHSPAAMQFRVNAGAIDADHWTQDAEIGGGRIIGEVCHFVDFMVFICGALPKSVFANALGDDSGLNDVVQISIEFSDGSIGTVSYLANGGKTLDKEYFEIFGGGQTAIIRDFKELEIHGKGRPKRKKLMSQDKGQAPMLKHFLDCIRGGVVPSISIEEQLAVSAASFAAIQSLQSGQKIIL